MKSSLVVNLLLLSLLLLFSSCFHKNPKESIAFKNRDKTWNEFRNDFLYNMQVIGVEEFKDDESFNVIVSEPPESLDTTELQKIVDGDHGTYEVKTHNIGVDGWVKDI